MDCTCPNGLPQLALFPPVFCKLILDIDRVLSLSRSLSFFSSPHLSPSPSYKQLHSSFLSVLHTELRRQSPTQLVFR